MVWAMILLYRSECDRLPFPFSFSLVVKTEHGAWCLLVGAELLLCSHLQPVYPILPSARTIGVHQFGQAASTKVLSDLVSCIHTVVQTPL